MAQTHQVRGRATSVFSDERGLCCVYHQTIVARKLPNGSQVELNTGGWRTATTKLRMNQFSNEHCGGRYTVFQKDHDWFVSVRGKDIPFDEQRIVITL